MRTFAYIGLIAACAGGIMMLCTHTVPYTADRIAIDRALAQRDPVFGLAGVDPDSLDTAIGALEDARDALAMSQSSARDARSILRLYPIDFLRALAALERRRVQLIDKPSTANDMLYQATLDQALSTGEKDAGAFSATFDTLWGSTDIKVAGIGGVTSSKRVGSLASEIRARFASLKDEVERRRLCAASPQDGCASAPMQAPGAPVPSRKNLSAADKQRIEDVRALYIESASVQTANALASVPIFVLSGSNCVPDDESPAFAYLPSLSGPPVLYYLNDMFFTPTAGTRGATIQEIGSRYGIAYSRVNATAFYLCPSVQEDLGTAVALARTREYALSHLSLVPEERAALLADYEYIYESDARAYVNALVRSGTPEDALPIVLMWLQRAGGLDQLVANIAKTQRGDVMIAANGIPFDLSPKSEFLTHSAFLSLFLIHNTSFARELPDAAIDESSDIVRYSSLRSSVPRGDIVRDMRSFLRFEGVEF